MWSLFVLLFVGAAECTSVLDFSVTDINENPVDLSKYSGYVTLIVNVASECGGTPLSYTELQQLQEKYYDKGLRILAFPCNQFGNQEKGTNAEILEFVKTYNVSFDMMAKINVNGPDEIPLYTWLKSCLAGEFGKFIEWNWVKFLSNKSGVPYKRYSPMIPPSALVADIEMLLSMDS